MRAGLFEKSPLLCLRPASTGRPRQERRAFMQLGERIRNRRQELGLSLRELAGQVGVTASFLSQIERDLASPSIESLRKISTALQTPIFYFLLDDHEPSPVVRSDQRRAFTYRTAGVSSDLLTPDVNRRMEALLTTIETQGGIVPLSHHPDIEEWIFVLAGQLQVQLGPDVYVLEAGDSIYFRGALLQKLAAHGSGPVQFISVMTPPRV